MIPVLPTRPITDMNRVPGDVLAMLSDNPVVLMQRSTPAAVMVSPAEWNATAHLIQELREQLGRERRLRISNQRYAAMLSDAESVVSQEEFDKMLADMELAE